jgi:NDP-sugar pyrophosphorylase family protein
VIVNVHHCADQVADYLKANRDFGMRIEISREDVLLDTGGGLKKAAWFFLEQPGATDEPFLLHNVDVLTTIDLQRLVACHGKGQALATLAVQQREASRSLLFDEQLQLCGRRTTRDHKPEMARRCAHPQELAFSGIHVLSPRILRTWKEEEGAFSIIDAYLRLVGGGERILAFRADEYYWRDLGKPESLRQAEQDLKDNLVRTGNAGL